jgi:hypothetical protein
VKYYLHIYVDGFLELQSIHRTENDAKKEYVQMRPHYPPRAIKGTVTWEIIEIKEKHQV